METITKTLKELGVSEDAISKINESFDKAVEERSNLLMESNDRDATQKLAQLTEQFDKKLEDTLSEKLKEQDEFAGKQLKEAFEKIDSEYTKKAKIMEEAKNKAIDKEIVAHTEQLAEHIDIFLENHIDSVVPTEIINEMVANNRAKVALDEISKHVSLLNLNEDIQEDSIKLQEENTQLKNKLNAYKKSINLEERCKGLDDETTRYITEMFKDSKYDNDHIDNNFDFAISQYNSKKKQEIISEKKLMKKETQVNPSVRGGSLLTEQSVINPTQTPSKPQGVMDQWQANLNSSRTTDKWLDSNGNIV